MTASGPEEPKPPTSEFSGLKGLALIAVMIPAMFWLGFGRIDGFVLGFTAFLVLLAAAVEYLPGITERAQARSAGDGPAPLPGPFDALGIVWLLAIPFAPFLTWILRNWVEVDLGNWRDILGITAFFCVAVPLLCCLPLLRYVRRSTAAVSLPILALGTAFPVMMGAGSAYDILQGSEWQTVEVTRLVDLDRLSNKGTRITAAAIEVDLADGRRLSRAPGAQLQLGPARVLVLRGTGRIIAARQPL